AGEVSRPLLIEQAERVGHIMLEAGRAGRDIAAAVVVEAGLIKQARESIVGFGIVRPELVRQLVCEQHYGINLLVLAAGRYTVKLVHVAEMEINHPAARQRRYTALDEFGRIGER